MGGRGVTSMSNLVPTSYPNVEIRRSIGAKYFFPTTAKDTDGTFRNITIGSQVTGIKAIAGAGTNNPIDDIKRLIKRLLGRVARTGKNCAERLK